MTSCSPCSMMKGRGFTCQHTPPKRTRFKTIWSQIQTNVAPTQPDSPPPRPRPPPAPDPHQTPSPTRPRPPPDPDPHQTRGGCSHHPHTLFQNLRFFFFSFLIYFFFNFFNHYLHIWGEAPYIFTCCLFWCLLSNKCWFLHRMMISTEVT